jgi:hypothetical protein
MNRFCLALISAAALLGIATGANAQGTGTGTGSSTAASNQCWDVSTNTARDKSQTNASGSSSGASGSTVGSTSHLAVRRPAIKVRVRAEARPHVRPVCQPASLRAIEWHLTVPFYYGSPCATNSLPANTALELFSPNDASSRCFASSVGRTLNRDGTTSASCD